MRPSLLSLALILPAGLFLATSCTELNPTFNPDARGQITKKDQGPVKFDGSTKWKDQQGPGDQFIPPFDTDPSCPPGMNRCGGKCVDLLKDPNNCGGCGKRCGGSQACMLGVCCNKNQANCGGKCKNLSSDPGNCGKCGTKCAPGQKCTNSKCEGGGPATGCKDGSDDQAFKNGMVGCRGKVKWSARATLCNVGTHEVCSADQWVQDRGGDKPKTNYWTDTDLRYYSMGPSCAAHPSQGTKCSSSDGPMRVCASKKDADGNTCNWTGCGYKSPWPNQHFGGCKGNTTAGSLCCPK